MQNDARAITIEEYNSEWRHIFGELAFSIRHAIGPVALRIDHIGSTSVPGPAAKPIIDIQISVTPFDPMEPYRRPLEELGLEYRDKHPELTKRYFKEPQGMAASTISMFVATALSPSSSIFCSGTTCVPCSRCFGVC